MAKVLKEEHKVPMVQMTCICPGCAGKGIVKRGSKKRTCLQCFVLNDEDGRGRSTGQVLRMVPAKTQM